MNKLIIIHCVLITKIISISKMFKNQRGLCKPFGAGYEGAG